VDNITQVRRVSITTRCTHTLNQRFPKRQIQPAPSGQRMTAVGKRIYSMKRQPGWTAPYDDIAAF
jgi:hypothetical protein